MRRQLTLLLLFVAIPASAASSPMHTLDYFQGGWHCEGTFPASGKTIASRMRYGSDLEGAALVKHHDDTSPPAAYHAIESWGYDARSGRYNAAVLDNFGGVRRFVSRGWERGTLTWDSAAEVRPAQRFVYTRLDQERYRVGDRPRQGPGGRRHADLRTGPLRTRRDRPPDLRHVC